MMSTLKRALVTSFLAIGLLAMGAGPAPTKSLRQ
jgi:hypothetical protein